MKIFKVTGEIRKTNLKTAFIKEVNFADYFMTELKDKGLPQGVIDSLKTIAGLEKEKEIGPKEVRTALKAVNTIFEIMA